MESMIVKYNRKKQQHDECNNWEKKIGMSYQGGGGGIGALISLGLQTGDSAPTIYYQAYDGATNYHPMPSYLIPYMEQAIKSSFTELLSMALSRQAEDLRSAAENALEEHNMLLKAAEVAA